MLRTKALLALGVSLISVASYAGAASAQTVDEISPASDEAAATQERNSDPSASTAAGERVSVEEITVTARRVSENLQDVPIAVTYVGPELLENRDVRNFGDLALNVPGLTIFGSNNSNNAVATNVRGVTGVVSYFAEVPATLQGQGYFFDLSNIQVLKGPQGTLFGISTNGGALLIEPRRPSATTEGYGQITVGDHGRLSAEGAINVPVVEDALRVRLAFITSNSDGFVRRLDTGELLGDEDYSAIRLSAVLLPAPNLENYTIVNHYEGRSSNVPNILGAFDPSGRVATVFGESTVREIFERQQVLGPYAIEGSDIPTGYTDAEATNIVNKTTLDLGNQLRIRNIFGWQREYFKSTGDNDGTILPINASDPVRTQDPEPTITWSEELQIVGSDLWGVLDFQVGTFHSWTDSDTNINYGISLGGRSAVEFVRSGRTHAVYGQADLDLSSLVDGLSATAGYRYTWDRRSEAATVYNPATQAVVRELANSADFENGSYLLGLQYRATPDVMFFVTASKGYSAGGFTLSAPPPFNVYQPETLENIEIGVKSQFYLGDVAVRANVSAYYGWYEDVQVTQARLVQLNPPPAPLSLVSARINAASAHPKGVDVDLSIIPTRNLRIDFVGSYVDAEYAEFDTLDAQLQPVSKAGYPFVVVPRWKISPRIDYKVPLDPALGRLSFNAAYTWYSRVLVDSSALVLVEDSFRPAREYLDVSINWDDVLGRSGVSASLFATNLTNETGTLNGLGGYSVLGTNTFAAARPRSFGVRLGYEF